MALYLFILLFSPPSFSTTSSSSSFFGSDAALEGAIYQEMNTWVVRRELNTCAV